MIPSHHRSASPLTNWGPAEFVPSEEKPSSIPSAKNGGWESNSECNSRRGRRLRAGEFSPVCRQLQRVKTPFLLGLLIALAAQFSLAEDPAVARQIAIIKAVGPKGKGHKEAHAAALQLQKTSIDNLNQVLAGMDGANPLATNWLRGVAEAIAQSHVQQGKKLPIGDLKTFFADTRHSPRGRRLAYELIASVDPDAEKRMIPALQTDPSLELRYDAIRLAMEQAAALEKEDKAAATKVYRDVFPNARDVEQTKQLAAKLKELGEKVDMPTRMGFVADWRVIGPFDNAQDSGWDKAFEPEKEIDFAAEYKGSKGPVKWIEHHTEDEFGIVNLNKVLDKHKGAIAYAATEFISDKDQTVDIRLGCINANKVWVNGELVTANRVYHTGMVIDQYQGKAKLKKGKNLILVRISQNEQTEEWAQEWMFQLRVTDSLGGPVLAQDRVIPKTAARLTERK
jgi:hypothetical protein